MAAQKCRVALLQLLSGADKAANVKAAVAAIAEAASHKADIVTLPECFNSPYATASFPVYAEHIPASRALIEPATHPTTSALSDAAREHRIYLVGGSIPERDAEGHIFNSCVVFGPDGEILAKHRKVHLFDIDIPGRITFRESDTLTGGSSLTTFDTPFGRCGVGICYDLRFPLLSALLSQAGCRLLFFPGAFNTTTGPAHWELLQRARALDTQCYVCTASPARSPDAAAYQAWGHSTVVNPWGEVVATTDETPGTVYADLQLPAIDRVRGQIPVLSQARGDLYELRWVGGAGDR